MTGRLILIFLLASILGATLTYIALRPHTTSTDTAESQIVAICAHDTLPKEQCYARELEKVGKAEGSEAGFALLKKIQAIDPDAYGCHFIAHGISYGAFERSPDTWQTDLRRVYPGCSYGGIHGYLEKAFDRFDLKLDAAHIEDICGKNPHADCNHSLGHLLLVEHEGVIEEALPVCDALTDQTQKDFCLGGVFMEEITATNLISHGIADASYHDWPKRLPSLTEACKSYDDRQADMCWTELAHAIVAKYGPDYAQTYAYCNQAPRERSRQECAKHAIGITLAVFRFDPSQAGGICMAVDENFKEVCHTQIISSLLSTMPDAIAPATAYCSSIEERHRTACVARIDAMRQYRERITPTEGL